MVFVPLLVLARRRRAPHMSLILPKISSSCPESGCLFDLTWLRRHVNKADLKWKRVCVSFARREPRGRFHGLVLLHSETVDNSLLIGGFWCHSSERVLDHQGALLYRCRLKRCDEQVSSFQGQCYTSHLLELLAGYEKNSPEIFILLYCPSN